jgi:hypothetical protein
MATLSLSISGSAIQNGTGERTIQDADLQTLIDVYKAKITTAQNPSPTNVQALNAWFGDIASGARDLIKRKRIDDAKASAEAGVADVVIS